MYFCFAAGIARSAGAEYCLNWQTAETARFAWAVLGAMLTALGVSRPVEFVSQKDRIDLVVQSMEVMARAAEANGQAEFDVDQFRRYK
jgi:hypothetical protein